MDLPIDVVALRATLRRHGVVFALIFGSQANGTARADSDVDLAVWAPAALDDWALRGDLPDAVDLTVLGDAPEWLAGRVACEGTVILDEDPKARVHWQADTRKRYLDEAFRRERFRADFLRAHG